MHAVHTTGSAVIRRILVSPQLGGQGCRFAENQFPPVGAGVGSAGAGRDLRIARHKPSIDGRSRRTLAGVATACVYAGAM